MKRLLLEKLGSAVRLVSGKVPGLLLKALMLTTLLTTLAKAEPATPRSTDPVMPAAVLLPGQSPLVSLRLLFFTGAASDPPGKAGLAALTAALVSQGGTRSLTYSQVLDRLYPLAADIGQDCDKEMTVFYGTVHRDNLPAYYGLVRDMLLEPGFRQEDFDRLKKEALDELEVSLRGNNDEELGKELLYNWIYRGHPYGHHDLGALDQLKGLTLQDVRDFYARHYHSSNLQIGLSGGYPADLPATIERDFQRLSPDPVAQPSLPPPQPIQGLQIQVVQKKTRSSALSLGFPLDVTRRDPDWPALFLAASYLGEHRSDNSHLYQRIREIRGLNYGDYAYLEYFPNGMFRFEPAPNLARRQQIFQIWIRPVEPQNAHFVLRCALFELRKLLDQGIHPEDFENTREFLMHKVGQLVKSGTRRLGYAMDQSYYAQPEDFAANLKERLSRLTKAEVDSAIRAHWQARNLKVVIITDHASELAEALRSDRPSPIHYNSPKPAEILQEDQTILKLPLTPASVEVLPVDATLR